MALRGKKSMISDELIAQICDYIRRGTWDWVACEMCGIPLSTFRRWMAWGEAAWRADDEGITFEEAMKDLVPTLYKPVKDYDKYLEMWIAVRSARAQARSRAEIMVQETEPYKWLRYGPGRDAPGQPGWGDESKLKIDPATEPRELKVQVVDYRQALAPLEPLESETGERAEGVGEWQS